MAPLLIYISLRKFRRRVKKRISSDPALALLRCMAKVFVPNNCLHHLFVKCRSPIGKLVTVKMLTVGLVLVRCKVVKRTRLKLLVYRAVKPLIRTPPTNRNRVMLIRRPFRQTKFLVYKEAVTELLPCTAVTINRFVGTVYIHTAVEVSE